MDILDYRGDDKYSLKTSKTGKMSTSTGREQGDLRKERVPVSEKIRKRPKKTGKVDVLDEIDQMNLEVGMIIKEEYKDTNDSIRLPKAN